MVRLNPLLLTDFYKVHHHRMYPKGTTLIYSNLTPRKSRIKGVNHVVVFAFQYLIKEYLINAFREHFFSVRWEVLEAQYKRHIPLEDIKHLKALHSLSYLPIEIKALPEGTLCPIGVPMMTIKNTHPDFAWLTNYLETLISCLSWQPMTSATIAYEYKKLLSHYAKETTGSDAFVQWQGHDFSMRGMSSPESAILSGMGHLTSFTGTDTIPAIYALEAFYNAKGLIGASVPATEHSVMCMGKKESELDTFRRLLRLYPTGILSVVSDTWNLWDVLTKYLPTLHPEIMNRWQKDKDNPIVAPKLVIRPDSGNPVNILCGHELSNKYSWAEDLCKSEAEFKGVVELLWDLFGGTVNKYGYKELHPCIGAIYGDSITLDRAREICERLKAKGFASTNVVLGIGSYTYQYNTRDTFGFAIKATYGEVKTTDSNSEFYGITEGREIFKDPITDDGTKKSKRGLLCVFDRGAIQVKDQATWAEEGKGILQTIFKDGVLMNETTLEEIREKLNNRPIG